MTLCSFLAVTWRHPVRHRARRTPNPGQTPGDQDRKQSGRVARDRIIPNHIERLAVEIASCRSRGCEILVVSSGAIVSGITKLGLREYPKSLPVKQAAAAVGQSRLMWAYEKAFEPLWVLRSLRSF